MAVVASLTIDIDVDKNDDGTFSANVNDSEFETVCDSDNNLKSVLKTLINDRLEVFISENNS